MAVYDGSEAVESKVILAELDAVITPETFTSYSPFTWHTSFEIRRNTSFDYGSGCFGFGAFGQSGSGTIGAFFGDVLVRSVIVGATVYTEAVSIAAVEATPERWFYDTGTKILYIHFTDDLRPLLTFTPVVGGATRYADKAVYIDDVFYQPRLKGNITIRKSRDPATSSVITHDLTYLTLDNSDGFFDDFNENDNQVGQPVRMFYGLEGAALADFLQVGESYIEEISIDQSDMRLKLLDQKKALSRILPIHHFDNTTYPDLKENNIGKPIPLAFGKLFNVPCVCLNEDETPTPAVYTFKVADTTDYLGGIRAVLNRYVDGVLSGVGESTGQLLEGQFNIAAGDYDPGQTVTADIIGLATQNLIENADCESATAPRFLRDTADGAIDCTFARDSAEAYAGTYSYKMTKTVAAGTAASYRFNDDNGTYIDTYFEGLTITFSVYVYVPTTGGPSDLSEVFIRLNDNDGGGFDSSDSGSPTAYDTWERLSITRTFRPGLTNARMMVRIESTAANGEYIYVDNIQVEYASSPTTFITREKWDNPLRLIEHLLDQYSDIEFISDNYDLTEWEAAVTNSNVKDCAVYVRKDLTVIRTIEKIISAVGLGDFIQLDNGKWTFRIFDAAASAVASITREEIIGIPRIAYEKNLYTSVAVDFAKDWEKDNFRREIDDTEETSRVALFKNYNQNIRETMIVNQADALAIAGVYLAYFNRRRIIEFVTATKLIQRDLMDPIDVQVDRISKEMYGTSKYEIMDIEKQLSQGLVKVTAREIPV